VSDAALRTAILISGGGSNMAALIRAAAASGFPARIALVISNVPDAGGVAKARAAGVPVVVIDHKPYARDRQAFERDLHASLVAHDIEFICLAGFMRVLTPWFVGQWEGRMINIHPSLLPAYKGLHTHARALEAGETEHGCTVHWVTAGLDDGPIIAQARVPVLAGDTPDTLAARVLIEEHRIYPEALADCARGRVRG
jgi:phosphoribosylglycinamide formyltransferase-1